MPPLSSKEKYNIYCIIYQGYFINHMGDRRSQSASMGGKVAVKSQEVKIMVKDGWHTIGENTDVYVEDGRVVRGARLDSNSSPVTAYPYKKCKDGSWENYSGVKYETFRSGLKKGTYILA